MSQSISTRLRVVLLCLTGACALVKPDKPTAAQVLKWMGRGINLGNVYDFDSGNDPSFEASSAMIDLFAGKGFTHVRIPVTWDGDFDATCERTRVVTGVVEYALGKGLYVILNTHHERWLKDSYNNTAYFNDRFTDLWTNIAKHFAFANHRLIFEILNEPDAVLGGWLPGDASPFDQEALNLTRAVNEVGYWAVRSVSAERIILLMPNGMGSQSLAKHVYPDPSYLPAGIDPYLGVSVHSYDPWDFCGETGKLSHFSSVMAMQAHMAKTYGELAAWYYETQIPLHIGEYGLGRVDKNVAERDTDMARAYYKFVTNTFALHGWPSTVWDDQGWFAVVKNFAFINGIADAALSTY